MLSPLLYIIILEKWLENSSFIYLITDMRKNIIN